MNTTIGMNKELETPGTDRQVGVNKFQPKNGAAAPKRFSFDPQAHGLRTIAAFPGTQGEPGIQGSCSRQRIDTLYQHRTTSGEFTHAGDDRCT